MQDRIKAILLILLPKNFFSQLVGGLADVPLPLLIRKRLFNWLINKYKINVDELEKPYLEYRTFNQFFTRRLKEGSRIFDMSNDTIISPSDGKIQQFGNINKGKLLQIKHVYYTVEQLLNNSKHCRKFQNGRYVTIYLNPGDFHHYCAPLGGNITHIEYIPGKLFPVNRFGVKHFKELLAINERVVVYFETRIGMVAMVLVGAFNVGSININFLPKLQTNTVLTRAQVIETNSHFMMKGEDLGHFKLGSTIVLLFERDKIQFHNCAPGKRVKQGYKIIKIT